MRLVGSCEHSIPSAFTQGQKFLDKLSVSQLFVKDFALWWEVQSSEYKDCCLLEWEALWSIISVPKNTAIFVCLFMNGLTVTAGKFHISQSLFTGGRYVTFHEKEYYVTYIIVLHCKEREYASTWAKTYVFIFHQMIIAITITILPADVT